jgi:hypothetical protein
VRFGFPGWIAEWTAWEGGLVMRRSVGLLTAALLLLAGPSLAETIRLTHKEYIPTFDVGLKQRYQGTHIYFYDFTNEAEDTGLWSYESETTRAKYKTQDYRLNYYLLYCFQAAGRALGMVVYERETSIPELRSLDLVFTTWSHEEFRCRVSAYVGGVKRVEKAFRVEFDRATSQRPSDLKQRAYDCITEIVATILEDEEIQAAFLNPAPGR